MFGVAHTASHQLLPLPGALGEIVMAAQVTGCLSRADRHGLKATILHANLSDEDRCAIDRLLRATTRGRIQICDEVSTLMS